MSIVQMTGKLTQKQALSLAEDTVSVLNVINDKFLCEIYNKLFPVDGSLRIYGCEAITKFGKPLVSVNEFESNPGLWIFDDTETDIRFLVWSDGHRKNSYKGTSYEVILKTDQQREFLDKAFERLIDHIRNETEHL